MWELVNLLLGMFAIWLSANYIVNSSVKIAKSLNLSEAFIGLTILSIGTSLPEIFTHIFSSIDILHGIEASGVSVGTNIGSNMIQITFIMGLLALFATVKTEREILKFDYVVMLLSIAVVFLFGLDGHIGRIEGTILAVSYIIFLIYLARQEHLVEINEYQANYIKEVAILLFGFFALTIAANTVVENALLLSKLWGISQSFIGVLIIGVSTALPEMTTAFIGILKGSKGISLGTLVGSNITNPLFALGVGAMISGYSVAESILFYDLPLWMFGSLVALAFFWKKLYLTKTEGFLLMLIYIGYGLVRFLLFA